MIAEVVWCTQSVRRGKRLLTVSRRNDRLSTLSFAEAVRRISKPPERVDELSMETDTTIDQRPPKTVSPMDTKQPRRQRPEVPFRVLIIGRANAGKTSILQRVCETTESPMIYRRREGSEVERVCGSIICLEPDFTADQVTLDPTVEVSDNTGASLWLPLNMVLAGRAQHRRRTGVLQPSGLRFSRFSWHRVRWYRGARNIARIRSTDVWKKATTR